MKLGQRLWFTAKGAEQALYRGDEEHFERGLRRAAGKIVQVLPNGHVVVHLRRLVYALTDYQEDAVETAAIHWAGAHFGFAVEGITITFEKDSNRYVISYDKPWSLT